MGDPCQEENQCEGVYGGLADAHLLGNDDPGGEGRGGLEGILVRPVGPLWPAR